MPPTPFRAARRRLSKQWWTLQRFGLSPSKLPRRFLNRQEPRVLCLSVPKSGTHLLERALCLHPRLYRRLVGTLYEGNIKRRMKQEGLYRFLLRLRPGQMLFSHLGYSDQRHRSVYASGVRTIFLIRDPRDVAVSAALYLSRRERPNGSRPTTEELREKVAGAIRGDLSRSFAPLDHVLEAASGWLDTEGLVVRFEDLVGPEGGGSLEAQQAALRSLYRHLGLPVEDRWLALLRARIFSSASPTFHQGQIGGWRNVFDDRLKELFKETAGAHLIRYGYERDDDW